MASLLGAVLVLSAIALLGEYTKPRGQLLLNALALGGVCLAALPPSALLGRRGWKALGLAGLLAAFACFALVTVGIWMTPGPDAFWKAAAIASVLAATAFLASLCVLSERDQTASSRIVLSLSLGATFLASLMSVLGILYEVTAAPHWWTMVLVVLASIIGLLVRLAARGARRARTNVGR